MSTNALIGMIDTSTGRYRARYVHSDGYPTGVGADLAAIVSRDGLAAALQTLLTERAEWSAIAPDQRDLSGVTPNLSAPHGSVESEAAYAALTHTPRLSIPGYGLTYEGSDTKAELNNWTRGTFDLDVALGTAQFLFEEWAYLFTGRGKGADLIVITAHDGGQVLARIPVSTLPLTSEEWVKIECGENFEWCDHYASHHVPNLPGGRDNPIGMTQWVGAAAFDLTDAIAITTKHGVRVTLGGSRWSEGDTCWASTQNAKRETADEWTVLYKIGQDRQARAIPGMTYHYPLTRVEHEATQSHAC